MGQQAVLHEATAKAKATESKGIWRIKLIEGDVHGSSGYYPASVLERDGATAFPAGTHIYLDHPTWEEDWQRPERSRSEEHTSELQSRPHLVCRLLLEKKN